MGFPPNSWASDRISPTLNIALQPLLKAGVFYWPAGETPTGPEEQSNQSETQASQAEQNYPLLREIAQD